MRRLRILITVIMRMNLEMIVAYDDVIFVAGIQIHLFKNEIFKKNKHFGEQHYINTMKDPRFRWLIIIIKIEEYFRRYFISLSMRKMIINYYSVDSLRDCHKR